ncbi:hypothetical protein E2C01_029048 [Portunus trituberculatus]|uniref:Uncharacterized protein n=1 Tax=Portunus trituberculatus TaxID=210409 RepID=A0A5B7EN55_PORTR|nr:hypothetical protein [Portunus trituberculatus]
MLVAGVAWRYPARVSSCVELLCPPREESADLYNERQSLLCPPRPSAAAPRPSLARPASLSRPFSLAGLTRLCPDVTSLSSPVEGRSGVSLSPCLPFPALPASHHHPTPIPPRHYLCANVSRAFLSSYEFVKCTFSSSCLGERAVVALVFTLMLDCVGGKKGGSLTRALVVWVGSHQALRLARMV